MMILKTERLILTEFTIKDTPFFFELVNDPDWIRFIGDRNVKELKDAENYLTDIIIPSYKNWGFGFYKVSLKDGTSIGTAGLIDREVLDHVDIGYAFLPKGRGKGYAIESSKAILSHALKNLKLEIIVAIVNMDNTKSKKLLQKLGMRFEKMVLLPDETEEVCQFTTAKI